MKYQHGVWRENIGAENAGGNRMHIA